MGGIGNLLSKGNHTDASADEPKTNDSAAKTDAEKTADFADLNRTVDSAGPEAEGVKKLWSSAPIMRLKIGKYQFDKGVLTLTDSDDVDAFEKLLKGLPARDRNQIKTISVELAESMVRPPEAGVTHSFDSSVGRQRETIAGQEVIGTKALDADSAEGQGQGEKFAKLPQTDNNMPVAGTEANHVVNEANQGDVDLSAEQRAEDQANQS